MTRGDQGRNRIPLKANELVREESKAKLRVEPRQGARPRSRKKCEMQLGKT